MEGQDRQARAPGALNTIIETDALVVGAGPVGLFQVFQLGLQGIHAQVVDSLPHAGGQCIELYPDKPIYDIPAVPVCSGRELVALLLKQIEPFAAGFHLAQVVSTVQPQADGRLAVETDKGTRFLAKTLFIAGGAGSFQPRGLKVESLAGFEGSQVVHGVDDPARFAGLKVVIVGGADVALTEALNMARGSANPAASVTLIHRRDQFQAPAAQVAAVKAMCASGQMRFIAGQVVDSEAEQGRLAHLVVAGTDGETQRVPVDMLVVCLGLSPRLGPIAHWGLGSVRKHLTVDTERFQTNVHGIFAVGDINSYPGKRKLIVSGFHEATLAAFAAAAQVFPDQPVLLQYTTTSPRLHERLGVRPPLLPD